MPGMCKVLDFNSQHSREREKKKKHFMVSMWGSKILFQIHVKGRDEGPECT